MSKHSVKDLSASVNARLLDRARKNGEDNSYVLIRYGVERFLFRLAHSSYRDKLILKGAMSFHVWSELKHRQTLDADFLGFGDDDAVIIEQMITEIIETDVENDGLVFYPDTIRVRDIMEGGRYHGKRIHLLAKLGSSQIRLQIDIGFGDKVTPEAKIENFPVLLDMAVPKIRVYPKETVVAEKFEAIVKLGMLNSRMKDYFDLLFIADTYAFKYNLLHSALLNTFENRNTEVPDEIPIGLSEEFANNTNVQWKGFLKRSGMDNLVDLMEVIERLGKFLLPLTRDNRSFSEWHPGGPWL